MLNLDALILLLNFFFNFEDHIKRLSHDTIIIHDADAQIEGKNILHILLKPSVYLFDTI